MSSIVKQKNGTFRAIIRRKGHRVVSQSRFTSEKAAKDWALAVEAELLHGIKLPAKAPTEFPTTLSEALEKYGQTETIKKKSANREHSRIERLRNDPIAELALSKILPQDITEYINRRKITQHARGKVTAESTVRLEVMLISALFTHHIKAKHEKLTNPVPSVILPGKSTARDRPLRDDEFSYLCRGFLEVMPRTTRTQELLQIAIETGMRESEILKVQYFDIDLKNRFIYLSDTKSGDPRDVPLSPKAISIFESLSAGEEDKSKRVFPVSQDALIRAFKKACKQGRLIYEKEKGEKPSPRFLTDLTFHNLRHASATRWSRYLHAQELAKMFGWKTLNIVMRYYDADVPTIASKLAQGSLHEVGAVTVSGGQ